MASVRFTDVPARPTEFLDLTSLTLAEFQQLVPPFEAAFQAHLAAWRLDGKPRTARRFTVYNNCPLPTPEDRLFFILTYPKTYALQVVQGRLLGMGQSKANQWMHVLLPALLAALRALGDTPARSLQETPWPGADAGATPGKPGAQPASATHRACQQQCQALPHCEGPDPPVEAREPRSGDGTLLCPAQLPGALESVAANGLIGINSMVQMSRPNSYRLMNSPITRSCMRSVLEKHSVRRTSRLIRVRRLICLLSIFCVCSLPT